MRTSKALTVKRSRSFRIVVCNGTSYRIVARFLEGKEVERTLSAVADTARAFGLVDARQGYVCAEQEDAT